MYFVVIISTSIFPKVSMEGVWEPDSKYVFLAQADRLHSLLFKLKAETEFWKLIWLLKVNWSDRCNFLQLSVRGKNKKEVVETFWKRLTQSADEVLLSGQVSDFSWGIISSLVEAPVYWYRAQPFLNEVQKSNWNWFNDIPSSISFCSEGCRWFLRTWKELSCGVSCTR